MDPQALTRRSFASGVLPDHDGHGLVNVAPTLAHHLAGRRLGGAPLAADALPPRLLDGVERVILVLADGLGWRQLETARRAGAAPTLDRLAREGSARALTSVLPSTTCTALTSLATGWGARRHGVLGYRTYLPSMGAVFNLIRMTPLLGGRDLFSLGMEPEEFLPFPTLGSTLRDAGVAAELVTRRAYVDSPLTRMNNAGIPRNGYVGAGDAFVQGRRAWERVRGGPGFVEVYWDEVDTAGHEYGPASDEYEGAIAALDAAIGRELVDRIDDPGTLFVLTADHGHVEVPPEGVRRWNDHPDVLRHLVVPPTGEGRFNYLHVRDGHRDATRDLLVDRFAGEADVMTVQEALAAGAFGPGPEHPELEARAGDLLFIPRDNLRFEYHLTPRVGPSPLAGVHGGVSADELLVPLVAARLG